MLFLNRSVFLCKQESSIFQLGVFRFRANRPSGQPQGPVKVQGQFQVHQETWEYPKNNRNGRLSIESISNYWSIMYWKVTRKQKMVKFLRLHWKILLSGDVLVHNWLIVAHIFNRKSTLRPKDAAKGVYRYNKFFFLFRWYYQLDTNQEC